MRTARCFIVALCMLVIVGVGHAQQAKPTRVVLTLKDGKTVAGELIEATPASVTLKPNPKVDPIITPWSAIKSAGGGLSRDAIVQEWRKSKPDQLCEACTGSATMKCATCDGTGVDPAQKQTCPKCEGTGSTGKCKTPNCVDGKVPCPDKCLKLESFSGVPDAEGKRWRKFTGKNGAWARVSDAHVGERVLIVDGVPQLLGKCPTCGGTTRVDDKACKGTGKTACPDCHGHGVVGPDCATCDDGQVTCTTCNGTGLKVAAAPAAPAAQ